MSIDSTLDSQPSPDASLELPPSTVGAVLGALQTEIARLWTLAVVLGDRDEANRFAAVSHALQQAHHLLDDQSSIG